ncbi:ParB/RepB/Spo0J family partition protein [Methylobacterium nonmethylotrophicum]|nr:ParB/RepB/Spo0J family partition protein [Methylobacterium nonmethylotrophicum]
MANADTRTLYGEVDADGRIPFWRAPSLWAAAAGATQVEVEVDRLAILDEVVWFGGPNNVQPTIRLIAERARDINEAILDYPIIMLGNGNIVDGAHRVAKAYLLKKRTIRAVIIDKMPEPDGWINNSETS